MTDIILSILFLIVFGLGIVGMVLSCTTPPATPAPPVAGDDAENPDQRGSIFLALFGAVAMVGILASATFAFLNGPLRTSVFLTQRNIAATQMNIAAQMAVAAAAAQANDGDCDGDGVIEPLPWQLSSGGDAVPPTGGGFIPMQIGTSKSDPWGSSYGYCVWDHGSKIADAACGGPSQKRRQGAASDGLATVAIISPGPDKAFQTSCNDFVDTAPADGQPDTDLVAKAAGSDDLLTIYTYLEAVGASSGLWQIKSGDANTATIGDKDIEVGGDASFSGQVITDSLNSRTGMLAVNDPLQLPDETRFPTCTAALVGALRRFNGNVEICGVTPPSTYAFKAVGGSVAKLDDLSDVITAYGTTYYNMFLGDQSGLANTTGNYNTSLGIAALKANTTGSNNAAFGNNALYSNTTGANNSGFGTSALAFNTTGNYNTAAGRLSLYSNTTGSNNSALGYQALTANTTGAQNTGVGAVALLKNTTGSANSAVGNGALQNNTTGSANSALGYQSLNTNSSGSYNTALGYKGLVNNTTGNYNTAAGTYALQENTTGDKNVAVGDSALNSNTTGSGNAALGYQALTANSSGGNNAAFGHQALRGNITGGLNTAVGTQALYANMTGFYNTAVGVQALYSNTADYSTALGYQALRSNADGTNNTAVGYQALYSNIGNFAGNKFGSYNTAIGDSALYSNNGNYNTAIGYQALQNSALSSGQTAIGYQALQNSKEVMTSVYNTAVGYRALASATTADGSVAVGYSALEKMRDGNYNTAMGYKSLINSISGNRNTALGYSTLYNTTSGTDNIAIGYQAMATNTGGFMNTVIGSYADVSSASLRNATALGYSAKATADNSIVLGNNAISAIYANVTSITAISDRRRKRDIGDIGLGLDFLRKLRPVEYRFNNGDDTTRYGFIAQEVEAALPKGLQRMVEHAAPEKGLALLSRQEDKARTYRLSYGELTAPLVRAVQELAATVDTIAANDNQAAADIAALKREVAELRKAQRSCAATKPESSGKALRTGGGGY